MKLYNKSRIKRVADRSKNFCIIPNDILQSTVLKPNEKSLLVHLLSMPDDWYYVKTQFWKQTNLGRNAFNTAWKGLEQRGYIKTEKIFEGNLLRGYDYTITDIPNTGLTGNRSNRKPVNKQSTNTTKDTLTKEEDTKEEDVVVNSRSLSKSDDGTSLNNNSVQLIKKFSGTKQNQKIMSSKNFDEYWENL